MKKVYDVAKLGLKQLAERGSDIMNECDFLSTWILNREQDVVPNKVLDKYRINLTSMMKRSSELRSEMGDRVYKEYPELYGENLHFNNDFTKCEILSDAQFKKATEPLESEVDKAVSEISDKIKKEKKSPDSKEMLEAVKLASKQKKASA